MAKPFGMEKEGMKPTEKVPGRKRGRPKKGGVKGAKNTGGGLPFFNPYGGKGKA